MSASRHVINESRSDVTASGVNKARYLAVRGFTAGLCKDLHPEDTVAQSMPDASPVKWHLAHTSWFFETFILEKSIQNYSCYNSEYRELFNSYYNSVGAQYLRPNRGLITRPTLTEVNNYRTHVDQHMLELLDKPEALSAELLHLIEVGLQHEQQHQELMLTDLKHLFSFNPLYPAYQESPDLPTSDTVPLEWRFVDSGLHIIGYQGEGYAFDNETPSHKYYLQPFKFASRLITNAEYLAFIEDGGYQRPELWLSDAWALLKQRQWQAPLYWQKAGNEWQVFTLAGLQALSLAEPVSHVSYYEADAYARWCGARLPTEQEWEVVARDSAVQGNFVDSEFFHPVSALPGPGVHQMFGDVWEWTQSPYAAYPGYRPPQGELAEYNGKFMCNQMVLRGGSCVTSQSHIRATYRNFFFPDARWQFSGIRLARSVD